MRMRSQRDMRSMLSKAALQSTNAMYNVRLCSLNFSIICRRAKIWSMVERPGMKPACCIRLRDLIAETDLRSRMSARSFPGIDKRVIPRSFAQVRRSPLRFQNGRMMPLRQSSGIFSLIQTQFIITCSRCSMHSPPNFKSSAVILHIPAALTKAWSKWRELSGVICDKKIPTKLKLLIYQTVIRPTLLYGCETWPIPVKDEKRMATTEMRMVRWAMGVSLLEHRRNEEIL